MKLFHGECEIDAINKRCAEQHNKSRQSSSAGDINSHGEQIQEGKPEKSNIGECRNCGRNHEARKCPRYGKECYRCQKKNHFWKKCRSDPKQSRKPYKEVKTIRADLSDDFVIDSVDFVNTQSTRGYSNYQYIKWKRLWFYQDSKSVYSNLASEQPLKDRH